MNYKKHTVLLKATCKNHSLKTSFHSCLLLPGLKFFIFRSLKLWAGYRWLLNGLNEGSPVVHLVILLGCLKSGTSSEAYVGGLDDHSTATAPSCTTCASATNGGCLVTSADWTTECELMSEFRWNEVLLIMQTKWALFMTSIMMMIILYTRSVIFDNALYFLLENSKGILFVICCLLSYSFGHTNSALFIQLPSV